MSSRVGKCSHWATSSRPAAAAAAESLQSCLTLCDPIDGSPPGSPVPGILQARTLEWVAISFSHAWKWKVKVDIRDECLILGSRRSPGGGHDNLLRYFCLKNLTDRGVWQATVHRVEKSWTWLKQLSTSSHLIYLLLGESAKADIKQFGA